MLVADIGGGTSDFSIVRVGPGRGAAGSSARPTSSPTTASTSPAPTSTAASSWPRSCRCFGYRRLRHRASPTQPAREVPSAVYFDLATWHLINTVYNPLRVAELRGMRSLLRRSGAPPAADDRRRRSASATTCWRAPRPPRSTVAEGGATTIDLEPRRARPRGASFDERRRPRRARRRPRPDRRRGARDGRPGRPAPAQIDALYFTGGSTGLRLLDRAAAARRFPRRGRCAATASPASRPGWRCIAQRSALRARRGPTLSGTGSAGEHRRHRQRRCASTLPVFRPATQMRPERTR